MTTSLFEVMLFIIVSDFQDTSVVDKETASKQANDDNRKKVKEKREAQPASEDYVKYKARQKEKAEGKDVRRKSHGEKEQGEPDRSKKRIDDDYEIE